MKKLNFKSKFPYLFIFIGLLVAGFVIASCEKECDYRADTANPTVVSYNPMPGAENVSFTSNLILTFDEVVEKGTGFISIISEDTTVQIDIASDAATLDEDARILKIVSGGFISGRQYTISLDRGIVKDLMGNEYMGMPSTTTWSFTAGGQSGPQLKDLVPNDGATDAKVFGLSIKFAADVVLGEGNIVIFNAAGTEVETIPVTAKEVTLEDNTLTVPYTKPLDFGTEYYINMDEGAIKDEDGNDFSGFNDETTWNFKTVAGSGSDLVVHLPFDNYMKDNSGNGFDAVLGANATNNYEFVVDYERGPVVHFAAGSYATLPKHDLLRPSGTQDFTVTFWTKQDKAIGSDPVLIGNSNWDSGGNPGWLLATDGANAYMPNDPLNDEHGWTINIANNERTRMDWDADQMENSSMAPSLADGSWHMVTMVFDRTNTKMHVYVDGVEYLDPEANDLTPIGDGSLWDETNDYPINIWEDGSGVYNSGSDTRKELDGYMDELKILNRAMSADEVASLYQVTNRSGSSNNNATVYLPLDKNLNDYSGNGLHATLGATATANVEFVNDAERGEVVHFVAGSYASLPKSNLLRPFGNQNFTVAFWTKQDNAIGSDPVLIGNSDWDSGGNPGWLLATDGADLYKPNDPLNDEHGWTINISNNDRTRMDWDADDAGFAPNLADGAWHMVAMVFDRDNAIMQVYVDGVEYTDPEANDLTPIGDGSLWDETNDYPINLWEDGTGKYNASSDTRKNLDGYMDELRIINLALSSSEIKSLYEQTNAVSKIEENAVVYLPMDNSLSDISGNRLHATPGATATANYEFVNDGERGKVVHFVPGSYASLPKHDLLRPSGSQSFSVNFWTKQDAAIGSDPVLIGNSNWDSGGNPGWLLATDGADAYYPNDAANDEHGWTINIANNDRTRIDWDADDAGFAPDLADGEWHMVTMVFDRDNAKMHVYVDGVEYVDPEANDLASIGNGSLWDETNDYPINLWEDGSGVYNAGSDTRKELDGYMDELIIINKALSLSEVKALYNK